MTDSLSTQMVSCLVGTGLGLASYPVFSRCSHSINTTVTSVAASVIGGLSISRGQSCENVIAKGVYYGTVPLYFIISNQLLSNKIITSPQITSVLVGTLGGIIWLFRH